MLRSEKKIYNSRHTVKYNQKNLTKVEMLYMGCCKKTTKKLMQVCFFGALIKEEAD